MRGGVVLAQHYRFFNSTEDDVREYQASEFAEYFSRFISDGIFSENGSLGLKVTLAGLFNITVASGYAFIKGYMYLNDTEMHLTLEEADATLDRIDRIVLRFDEVNRTIGLVVKKGILASSPVAPTLENTSTLKELSLAQIKVQKGTIGLNTANLIDERLTKHCGQVSMLIDVPLQEMWNIWNTNLDLIQNNYNTWKEGIIGTNGAWTTWFTAAQTDYINLIADLENDWNAWFDNIQNDTYITNSEISGIIVMWSGLINNIPIGWALCNGENGTPDLTDRFIMGATSQAEMNKTGGENQVSLTVEQMPSHSHGGRTSSTGAHSHSGSTNTAGSHSHTVPQGSAAGEPYIKLKDYGGSGTTNIPTSTAGSHSHSLTTASAGSHFHSLVINNTGEGEPHENRPAYYALAFIMRL